MALRRSTMDDQGRLRPRRQRGVVCGRYMRQIYLGMSGDVRGSQRDQFCGASEPISQHASETLCHNSTIVL